MNAAPLPTVFAEQLAEPAGPLVRAALEQGRRAIGVTCAFVPDPLLSVDGMFPTRLRAPGVAGAELADTYLSSVLCSYTRSLLELALEGRLDHLAGWVFTASCDHLRRLHDNLVELVKPPFTHVLDLPHKRGEAALAWWIDEIRALAARFAGEFAVDLSAAALREAIVRHNRWLAVMRRLAEARQADRPTLTGADFLTLLAASAAAPKDLLLPALEELAAALPDRPPVEGQRARLLLVGSGLDDPAYVRAIESTGALIVAERICVGPAPDFAPIPEQGDPLVNLATHYLEATPCPRMMGDFERRAERIRRIARDCRVDGVIVETMKFCDIWAVEALALNQALRGEGLAVLRLEREYALSGEGQLRTRVQAFLESLGR